MIYCHEDRERVDRLIASIVALSDVTIPSDTSRGLQPLAIALERINQNRQVLSTIASRVLVYQKTWQAEVGGKEAEFKIRIDELLVNDAECRSAPNKESRLARARAKAIDLHREVVKARKEFAMWNAIHEVTTNAMDNLRYAKESVSRICNIAEMERFGSNGIGRIQ